MVRGRQFIRQAGFIQNVLLVNSFYTFPFVLYVNVSGHGQPRERNTTRHCRVEFVLQADSRFAVRLATLRKCFGSRPNVYVVALYVPVFRVHRIICSRPNELLVNSESIAPRVLQEQRGGEDFANVRVPVRRQGFTSCVFNVHNGRRNNHGNFIL